MKKRLPAWLPNAVAVSAALFARPLLARLLAAGAIAGGTGAVAVSADLVSLPGGKDKQPIPAWINKAGPYPVEHVQGIPCSSSSVDLARPPAGVGHTIEGSLESGLSVFRRHYAPHFVVGDRGGKAVILQLCPLGTLGLALRNQAGGPETNRWARAQIELAGFSKRQPWQPTPHVMRAFSALLLQLRDSAGIPLRRGSSWGQTPGWFNHADVPENDHWDMGAFQWPAAIRIAEQLGKTINRGHGHAHPRVRLPKAYWVWARWRLGHAEFRRCGPAKLSCRPRSLPRRIPSGWWLRLSRPPLPA